jgi:hypothetical protein
MRKSGGDFKSPPAQTSAFSQQHITITCACDKRALGGRAKAARHLLDFFFIQVTSAPAGKYSVDVFHVVSFRRFGPGRNRPKLLEKFKWPLETCGQMRN